MTAPFSLAHQRILILAPHPDDESLATGGLIQRAFREHAEVHVVFVSDGENNPWPQRFLERRWKIGQPERKRWGTRRREEALAALHCLGVPKSHAHFLGLPDQGTTAALLRAQDTIVLALGRALTNFRPTLLVSPSPHDIHPDHNALAVLVNLALARSSCAPDLRVLHYLVHTRAQRLPTPRWALALSPEERAVKYQAILQHGSQMALSGRRFLAYARSVEYFYPPEAVDPQHPIRYAGVENGALRVCVEPTGSSLLRSELFVAFENPLQGTVRWRIPVPSQAGIVRIQDATTGRMLRRVTVRRVGGVWEFRLPLFALMPAPRIALKFDRRLTFYDEAGWREFAIAGRDHPHRPSPTHAPLTRSSTSFILSPFGGVAETRAHRSVRLLETDR